MTEEYQFTHGFSLDPVFDSAAALFTYDHMDDADSDIRREICDSAVLIDFQELAWSRSHIKAATLKSWRQANKCLDGQKRELKYTKVCEKCGKEFHPSLGNHLKQRFCSKKCGSGRGNDLVCRKGHLLTPENTTMHHGVKTCKTCNKEYARAWKQKRKEKRELELALK